MSRYELEVFAYIEWCKKHNLKPNRADSLARYCKEKTNEKRKD